MAAFGGVVDPEKLTVKQTAWKLNYNSATKGLISNGLYLLQIQNDNPRLTWLNDQGIFQAKLLGKSIGSRGATPSLRYGRHIYAPGVPWFRIDPDDWSIASYQINDSSTPIPAFLYVRSVHYGILGHGYYKYPWMRVILPKEKESK